MAWKIMNEARVVKCDETGRVGILTEQGGDVNVLGSGEGGSVDTSALEKDVKKNADDIAALKESVGEENFTLIDKVTITDSDLSMVMRTAEPNGTPYDFKKLLVKVVVPKGNGKAAGQININTDCVALWREDLINDEKQTASVVRAVVENGNINILPLCSYAIDERTAPSYRPDYFFRKMENIKALSVFVSTSSFGFPLGTSIEIYAVRRGGTV